jgi:hypothetical protein
MALTVAAVSGAGVNGPPQARLATSKPIIASVALLRFTFYVLDFIQGKRARGLSPIYYPHLSRDGEMN